MKFLCIIVVTLLYAIQACVFLYLRDWSSALALIGYSAANIGLIWSWS